MTPGGADRPGGEGVHERGGRLVVERHFRTGPEAVFDVLADGWSFAGWVVGASAIRDVDPGWPRPGARIHHSVGVWPLVLDDTTSVVGVDRPHRLVLQARARPFGEATVTLELEPDGNGGCVVRMIEDATHGFGRLVPRPLRQLGLLPRNRESLRRLEFLSRRFERPSDGSG